MATTTAIIGMGTTIRTIGMATIPTIAGTIITATTAPTTATITTGTIDPTGATTVGTTGIITAGTIGIIIIIAGTVGIAGTERSRFPVWGWLLGATNIRSAPSLCPIWGRYFQMFQGRGGMLRAFKAKEQLPIRSVRRNDITRLTASLLPDD
jgi:hypothetical protein